MSFFLRRGREQFYPFMPLLLIIVACSMQISAENHTIQCSDSLVFISFKCSQSNQEKNISISLAARHYFMKDIELCCRNSIFITRVHNTRKQYSYNGSGDMGGASITTLYAPRPSCLLGHNMRPIRRRVNWPKRLSISWLLSHSLWDKRAYWASRVLHWVIRGRSRRV